MIQEYSKNPVNNYEMEGSSVSQIQGNAICGDDVVVFLNIDNGVVTKYSYAGNPSTITSAAASLLADLIE